MGGQTIAAIIAFAAGVIVTAVSGWFTQRIGRRKHVTQLSSNAFIDAVEAIAENQQCEAVLNNRTDNISEDEKAYWLRRTYETRFAFYSAKSRIAAYGSKEVGSLLANIERQGGVDGDNPITRQMAAKMVLSLRKELGFKKNDISEKDVAALLFGPRPTEREREPGGWPRFGPRPYRTEAGHQPPRSRRSRYGAWPAGPCTGHMPRRRRDKYGHAWSAEPASVPVIAYLVVWQMTPPIFQAGNERASPS